MLPVKKVVLYKHGVGYFEREGKVDGDASIDLHFKALEMNDVLKSLTTLDLDGGLISSVSYESTRPIAKQLEEVAIQLADQNAVTGLLTQVKGARVAVDLGTQQVEGTVMGIETEFRKEEETLVSHPKVALLVDGQFVRTFDLAEVKSIRLLEESLKKDLQHLLDILISAKKKDLKRLTIFAKGKGKRTLLTSYIVETPVWKTSYRMILGEKKPLLQGWALVDNTQEEDWENVALSLVAGLPISFVHDLYSPRYKRRPVVQVQEEEAYAPPQLESGAPVDEVEVDIGGDEERSSRKRSAKSYAAGAAAPATPSRDMAAARQNSVQVQTRSVEVGDLFEYAIKNPVTVKRGQSALVPILQGSFEGKRVAVYNPEVREKNPMSAILFTNSTGMTLEGGPVTVLDNETYVGESMLETMKPEEERLVPYSVELGCRIVLDDKSELLDVRAATLSSGTLTLYRYRLNRKIYSITNRTDRKIDLFLEHRFTPGWDLVETEKPVEKTDHFYRFRTEIPAKKTVKFTVTERGDEYESHEIQNVDRAQVKVWVESRYIDRKTMSALLTLVDLSEKAGELDARIAQLDHEVKEIFGNQERLRKNLQALGSSSDEKGLRERYVAELSREEDKLKELRDASAKVKSERSKVEKQLRSEVGSLKYDVTF